MTGLPWESLVGSFPYHLVVHWLGVGAPGKRERQEVTTPFCSTPPCTGLYGGGVGQEQGGDQVTLASGPRALTSYLSLSHQKLAKHVVLKDWPIAGRNPFRLLHQCELALDE